MNNLKICLLGNMNNNNYVILRYFLDYKLDVELLLFNDELSHFKPSDDSYDKKYHSRIKQLSWGSFDKLIFTNKKKICQDLISYNYIIGTGLAPAYCYKANIKLNMFIPYGADLFYFTTYNLTHPKKIIPLWVAVYYQRRGIKKVDIWNMKQEIIKYENKWKSFKGNSKRIYLSQPFIYLNEYNNTNIDTYFKNSEEQNSLNKIKKNNDLILLSHARHYISENENDPNNKGTNILIEGINLFLLKNPEAKIKLITFEYGPHSYKIKKLIKFYKLDKHVIIFPMTSRKKLALFLKTADLVCGQFGKNSNFINGVSTEALAFSKPLMTYRNDALHNKTYDGLFDIINVNSAEEIADSIKFYINNKTKLLQIGESGFLWYKKNIVSKFLNYYLNYFKNLK